MTSSKLGVFLFLGSLVLVLVFFVLYVVFETLAFAVFCLVALVLMFIFSYLVARLPVEGSLHSVLRYHKAKEDLLLQKNELQKQYMKRTISEKQFKIQISEIDKKMALVDYTIAYGDNPAKIHEDELKRKIGFVQKLFFKREISEDVYNALQGEFSKESAKLTISKKKKELL